MTTSGDVFTLVTIDGLRSTGDCKSKDKDCFFYSEAKIVICSPVFKK